MPKISARDVVNDIRAGMDDDALKTKYGLTDKLLAALYEKLTERGLLDVGDLDSHTTVVEFPEAEASASATPDLIDAVKSKDLVKLVTLVQEDADLNVLDTDGATPVIVAAREGNESIAQFLVYSGSDTTLKDASGKTALDWAIEKGSENIVLLLRGKRFSCPACGAPQDHFFDECPKCGVIVHKYYDGMPRRLSQTPGVASRFAQSSKEGLQSPAPEYPDSLPTEPTATGSANSEGKVFSHRQSKGSADWDRSWFSEEEPWWKTILVVPVAFLVVIIVGGSFYFFSEIATMKEHNRKLDEADRWRKTFGPAEPAATHFRELGKSLRDMKVNENKPLNSERDVQEQHDRYQKVIDDIDRILKSSGHR